MALFVMACSQDKHAGTRPAGLKYNARQHRALFHEFFVEQAYCSHDALILSAEFGFLPLSRPIPDYDLILDDVRAAEIVFDDAQVRVIASALAEMEDQTVYVYGGKRYRDAVRAILSRMGFLGQVVDVVGPNRGCCDHFAALQGLFRAQSVDA